MRTSFGTEGASAEMDAAIREASGRTNTTTDEEDTK